MALIDSSAVFTTPEEIFLRDSLNLSIIPQTFQKFYIPFTVRVMNEYGQNALKLLNLVNEILKTFKVHSGKYSK